ncbi:MAG: S1 RNA-binding domain-containing protein [Lachnospiraceae bacterium]|nr:S1 RNA-binding domain-containing protein [Lachnospiraceae bacterium]
METINLSETFEAVKSAQTMESFETEINESLKNFKETDGDSVWGLLEYYMEENKVLPVTVDGVVKGGLIAYVDGVRGFIPGSQLDMKYVEDLNSWLKKNIEVKIIELDFEKERLVLSRRAILVEKAAEEKKARINAITAGSVLEGKVETLKPYGAFIDLGDGISGLVHISQISQKRIKTPGEILTVGDTVKVKVLKVEEGKLSLSMKALEEIVKEPAEEKETFDYKEEGEATTSLGALLAGFTFE